MRMSNQEAIEIIKSAQAQIEWDYPMDYAVAFDVAISAIKAQDLQPTCNQLATDTISRKTAIDVLCRRCDLVAEDDEPCTEKCNDIKILEKLPSAQHDIIHCRECKNCQIDSVFHDYWCDGRKVWKDHYCGYAERRTDEEVD